MLVLLAVTYYLYLRLRDNKPIIKTIRIVKRLLPHQKAMKEIEQIKADKMVSSENSKEYYTKLTDTLRKYIEERYGFNAMEMTSSEIIDKLTATQDENAISELRQLFLTADLVKFAKYSTLINENDRNLVNAIDFINQTKQGPAVAEGSQDASYCHYFAGYGLRIVVCLCGLYTLSVVELKGIKWNLPIKNICFCSCWSYLI